MRGDVTMTVGDTNETGGLDVPGGVIFWGKEYDNFYCLCIDGIGAFKISQYVTNQWLTPVSWTRNEAVNKGVEKVNRLRVVTKGSEATAYINDKQVATIRGQPPIGGSRIGLFGGSAKTSRNTSHFSDPTLTTAHPPTPLPPIP